MLVQQTDKWRSVPPIMTDPLVGIIRRPSSHIVELDDRLAAWLIEQGFAIAYSPAVEGEQSPSTAEPEPDPSIDLILDFVNEADPSEIEAVRGITAVATERLVGARPVSASSLSSLLTPKQIQSLRQFVEGGENE